MRSHPVFLATDCRRGFRRRGAAAVLCAFLFSTGVGHANSDPANGWKAAFPRISGIFYNKSYDNPDFQRAIAKHDLGVLGFFKGWEVTRGITAREAVLAIKKINPGIKLGQYTLLESAYYPANAASDDIYNKLTAEVGPSAGAGNPPNDWWLRDTAGAIIYHPDYEPGDPGSDMAETNITGFVTPDGDGNTFSQWFAVRSAAEFFMPVPEFDFCFSDNAFYMPRVDADWNRDTRPDLKGDPVVQTHYRKGMASYWAKLQALKPGLLIMGNTDGHPTQNKGFLYPDSTPEYTGMLGGAMYETAFGSSWSGETWSGWHNTMRAYRSLMRNTTSPHAVIFSIACLANGKAHQPKIQPNYGRGADFAFMRYALASALMDDGYVEFHPGTYTNTTPLWFDEFDLAGEAAEGTSWLGVAIDPPQEDAYQDGVFLRRFENGAAIVNPRTNDVILGTGPEARPVRTTRVYIPTTQGLFKRINGTQAPTVNNGQNLPLDPDHGNTPYVDLFPGDGILLVRQ